MELTQSKLYKISLATCSFLISICEEKDTLNQASVIILSV